MRCAPDKTCDKGTCVPSPLTLRAWIATNTTHFKYSPTPRDRFPQSPMLTQLPLVASLTNNTRRPLTIHPGDDLATTNGLRIRSLTKADAYVPESNFWIGERRENAYVPSIQLAPGATYVFKTIPLFSDRPIMFGRIQYWPDSPGHYVLTFEYTGDASCPGTVVAKDIELDLD